MKDWEIPGRTFPTNIPTTDPFQSAANHSVFNNMMKISLRGATVAVLIAIAASASPVFAQEKSGGTYLQNGGFQEGLSAWKASNPGVELQINPTGTTHGDNHVKIVVHQDRVIVLSQKISGLAPGQKYRASARIRKNTSEDGRFIVRNVDTGKYLVWRKLVSSDEWTPIEVSFTAPADGGASSIEFNFRSPGTCEIDDIAVAPQE